jgi:hypothetical protein
MDWLDNFIQFCLVRPILLRVALNARICTVLSFGEATWSQSAGLVEVCSMLVQDFTSRIAREWKH